MERGVLSEISLVVQTSRSIHLIMGDTCLNGLQTVKWCGGDSFTGGTGGVIWKLEPV